MGIAGTSSATSTVAPPLPRSAADHGVGNPAASAAARPAAPPKVEPSTKVTLNSSVGPDGKPLGASGRPAAPPPPPPPAGTASNAAKPATIAANGKVAASAASTTSTATSSAGGVGDTDGVDGEGAADVTDPSPVKAFTYGALGLENPAEPPPPGAKNSYFSAGKFLAAAVTVGTIISLVV
jgi:hypothetical protein